jgi:hypothetical protein
VFVDFGEREKPKAGNLQYQYRGTAAHYGPGVRQSVADLIQSNLPSASPPLMGDRPWCEWGRTNKPIKPSSLSRQLQHFGMAPSTIRIGMGTFKGYDRKKFEELFTRYLQPPHSPAVTPSQVNVEAGYSQFRKVTSPPDVTAGNHEISQFHAGCDGVTAGNGVSGERESFSAQKCHKCSQPLDAQDKGITWLIDNGASRHKQCPV